MGELRRYILKTLSLFILNLTSKVCSLLCWSALKTESGASTSMKIFTMIAYKLLLQQFCFEVMLGKILVIYLIWLHYSIQRLEIHNHSIFFSIIYSKITFFWDYVQNLSDKVLFWTQIRIQSLKIARNTMVLEKVFDIFFVLLCN